MRHGLLALQRQFETMRRNAQKLSGPVAFDDLFPSEFMRRYTEFKSSDEMLIMKSATINESLMGAIAGWPSRRAPPASFPHADCTTGWRHASSRSLTITCVRRLRSSRWPVKEGMTCDAVIDSTRRRIAPA